MIREVEVLDRDHETFQRRARPGSTALSRRCWPLQQYDVQRHERQDGSDEADERGGCAGEAAVEPDAPMTTGSVMLPGVERSTDRVSSRAVRIAI